MVLASPDLHITISCSHYGITVNVRQEEEEEDAFICNRKQNIDQYNFKIKSVIYILKGGIALNGLLGNCLKGASR